MVGRVSSGCNADRHDAHGRPELQDDRHQPGRVLKDVLGRLPHIKAGEARELTPAKWLAARKPASRTA
jgi:hypothetical protein